MDEPNAGWEPDPHSDSGAAPIKELEVRLRGKALLEEPLLNKGSAFTEQERIELGLIGLLPTHVSTVDEQLERTYYNFSRKTSDLEKYIFLVSLQDRNETLFYKLLMSHLDEMIPVVYTPVVGEACEQYSHIYRRPRGLYIPFPQRGHIGTILRNALNDDVAVIVVTDGGRILGLGDLGIGGIGISIGKLSLYSACAGIAPHKTLPIVLDVGTDNRALLDDPLYLGWRHERITGQEYDEFVEEFVQQIIECFPDALLQWEDFSQANARRLLEKYRDRLCTFNDDIQGTGAVTLAGLVAAARVSGSNLAGQTVVMAGAGSAALGIADTILAGMAAEGLNSQEARSRIWLLDSHGLLTDSRGDLTGHKSEYAQPAARLDSWTWDRSRLPALDDVVRNVKPSALVGVAARRAMFTEDIIREMARNVERPIIFPLSNPTSKSEAEPSDLLSWTGGRALVATGSPFRPVELGDSVVRIGQCNNALIFPGLGLATIATHAKRVSDSLFAAAAMALAELSPALDKPTEPLFPSLENARLISRHVALAVAKQAIKEGLTAVDSHHDLGQVIAENMWTPEYARYRLAR